LSLREALQWGDNHIGDEHITLALIREGQGVAAQVMEAAGISYESLEKAIAAAQMPIVVVDVPEWRSGGA
jgi:ATP-dependent Clp protease ATP-binding subunit ClpC